MMKYAITGLCTALLLTQAVSAQDAAVALDTDMQKISYAMGMQFARNMTAQGVAFDMEAFSRAVSDMVKGAPPALSEEDARTAMTKFQQEMMQKQQARMAKLGEENIVQGAAYRETNAKKEGVKVTDSGLQYEVLKDVAGPKPKASDNVKVHYVGTLIDGNEFDSSLKRGQPAGFKLDQVIPGWTEGLQLMSVGSKYRFVIPPELAYGDRGAPPVIGPNSTLTFEVELLSID